MDRHHSTLELVQHDETVRAPELVKHDETIGAPERDWDATAFELDASALAPQVVVDTTPQVFYNESYPEVHNIEESTKERAPSPHMPKPKFRWSLMVMVLIIAMALAIGVGVGIWRHRQHGSYRSSTATSPPAPRPMAPLNTVTTSNPKTTSAAQYILNDTSLAALFLDSGDRQLFFQDNNGSIRRAIRTASDEPWVISPHFNLSASSKKHTPLAATVYVEEGEINNVAGATIGLFYVSESYTIIADVSDDVGNCTPEPSFGNWTTAANTRSLSFCLSNGTRLDSNPALLFYENPTGKISALLRHMNGTGYPEWIDITSQGSRSLPEAFPHGSDLNYSLVPTLYEIDTYATFSTPFTCTGEEATDSVQLAFYSPNATDSIRVVDYESNSSSTGHSGFIGVSGSLVYNKGGGAYSLIHRSDTVNFVSGLIWINGTQPAMIKTSPNMPLPGTPKSPFPFARLASVTSQYMTYLYHQINGTTFAEEQWDGSEGTWGPTQYIHVTDL